MQQIATGIGATVVDTTRVDTGTARSNWRATLGAPAVGVIPPYSPGNKLGQGETANAGAAKAQQQQVISAFNIDNEAVIFITNNVPYIEKLNNGTKNIAPGNMVEQGFLTGRAMLKIFKIKL